VHIINVEDRHRPDYQLTTQPLAASLARVNPGRTHFAPKQLRTLARNDCAFSAETAGHFRRNTHLVIDDFLLTSPTIVEAKDLLEVIDDRSQLRSTLVVSQLPVENWHPTLAAGDPTLADAILDRLIHNAHRLALKGSSMRRRQPPPVDEPPVA
jgi:DNA replication protein DnaC